NEDGEDDKDGESDNEDEEDDKVREGDNEYGKCDNKDGEDENNDNDDTDQKTTTTNDKIEQGNDENVRSTPTETSNSGRDPSTTSTEIVVKNVRYTPAAEEVRRQEDTPYMLGRSSVVGTSKVPSCACECLKCNENMNMLLSKIEALIEAQGVTKASINKLIFKRGIYPSSKISNPFTPIAVKRRRNQIYRALASAKKKVVGTPKMTADQPMERLSVNLYKYADDKKKRKVSR
ncbi:hypothetical protein HAX54_026804, partial [Datura stramonium]|nr:hypothetical protein [Datura stramonium]